MGWASWGAGAQARRAARKVFPRKTTSINAQDRLGNNDANEQGDQPNIEAAVPLIMRRLTRTSTAAK